MPEKMREERPWRRAGPVGGLKALMGAYHKFLIITELLGPVH